LLLTLAEDSLVSALPGGYFRLGQEVARLGAIAMGRLQPSPVLHDLLSTASAVTGETAGMLQLIDGVATVVDKVESSHPLRYHLGIGTRLPAHCTASGKVLLAFGPVEHRDRLLHRNLPPLTDNTITARDRLDDELQLIRTRGYAVDNQEFQEGLYCLAMPVRDFSGQVVYAIAISGPAQRFQEQHVPGILSALRDTTRAMEAALGVSDQRDRTLNLATM
jgi:DNA-binding IclR family transcriptional regulator